MPLTLSMPLRRVPQNLSEGCQNYAITTVGGERSVWL